MTDDIYRHPAREWPIPPMDKGSGWKDTAFTWAMGNLILQRIADGDTMKAITADPRMPAYCTVFRWMQVVPEFGQAVADVRARLAEMRQAERDALRRARGPRRRSGRRSTLSAERAGRLLAALRDGASLSEVVAEPGAPSFRVVYRALRNCPGFRAAFVDCCDWRNGWLRFKAELVVDQVFAIGIPAANAKIRALNARAGQLTPKLYRARRRT